MLYLRIILLVFESANPPARDHSIPDPELSELGRSQCLDLREHLKSKLPEGVDIDLILVSPMRRTIETALSALDFLIEKGVPIQAHAAWQGKSAFVSLLSQG